MCYVLRVVPLMYSNVVESKIAKRLRVYICIMTQTLYIYEMMFLWPVDHLPSVSLWPVDHLPSV